MISQHEFIESCLIKYRYQQIPEGVEWNDAHHPKPRCKNGIETVPLWKSDHAAPNVIQSEELGHPCIWGWEIEYLVGEYGYLVPYFHKWKSILGRQSAAKIMERGVGIYAPGMKALGGKVTQEKKLGLFGLSPEDKKEAERKGGRKAGKLPRWTNGITNRYCTEQPGPDWYPGVTRKKKPSSYKA